MPNCANFCKHAQISVNMLDKIPNLKDIFKAVKESLDFKDNFIKPKGSSVVALVKSTWYKSSNTMFSNVLKHFPLTDTERFVL